MSFESRDREKKKDYMREHLCRRGEAESQLMQCHLRTRVSARTPRYKGILRCAVMRPAPMDGTNT